MLSLLHWKETDMLNTCKFCGTVEPISMDSHGPACPIRRHKSDIEVALVYARDGSSPIAVARLFVKEGRSLDVAKKMSEATFEAERLYHGLTHAESM
jgi:hypothetical protein